MPALNIKKSIEIDAPIAKVYETLNDFHHWSAWSPWLIMDPKGEVDVQEDGKYYKWSGDLTGEGEMTVLNEVPNEAIDYDLTFLKPWKSKAKVRFELSEQNGQTTATWLMDSSLPFFLFFMKKRMTALLGMDYERGLHMLKEYVEEGKVYSHLDFKGESEFPGYQYIGIRTTCHTDDLGPTMQTDLEKLDEYMKGYEELKIDQPPFSIYHKYDMVKNKAEYTSGIPVREVPTDLPDHFITGAIPATKIFTLQHTGNYQHLGNAWSTMYSMQQNKKIKVRKGIHPFETYDNDPAETAAEDLVTSIHFAIR
ncbi:MAG TPA: SRPBCC family protein [Saprospiraceae bacterium]|nr:SRPBCC family protein [Saprospiraceae bacterium]